jgi:L,D-peptidoglycan transpeptidase YkuD (ErfK/YbiS/YcfS/YnhG family)
MKKKASSKPYALSARDHPLSWIRIRAKAGNSRQGWLGFGGQVIPVALGRGGILANKREGDGGTPKGTAPPHISAYSRDSC